MSCATATPHPGGAHRAAPDRRPRAVATESRLPAQSWLGPGGLPARGVDRRPPAGAPPPGYRNTYGSPRRSPWRGGRSPAHSTPACRRRGARRTSSTAATGTYATCRPRGRLRPGRCQEPPGHRGWRPAERGQADSGSSEKPHTAHAASSPPQLGRRDLRRLGQRLPDAYGQYANSASSCCSGRCRSMPLG